MEILRASQEPPKTPRKRAGFFAGVVGGVAALTIACGGGNGTDSKAQNPDTPNLPAATEPFESPTRISETSSIVITPSPEPTPTQEVKQEVPCEILPQEFCGQAEVIEYKTLDGTTLTMLGFKSIPAGTKFITPLTGRLEPIEFAGGEDWKGWGALITDPSGSKNVRFIGDFSLDPKSKSINEGDAVAAIRGSGVDNFGYSLLLSLTKQENGVYTDDAVSYEALFPGITSHKPIKIIEQTSRGISLGDRYFPDSETPPPGSSSR